MNDFLSSMNFAPGTGMIRGQSGAAPYQSKVDEAMNRLRQAQPAAERALYDVAVRPDRRNPVCLEEDSGRDECYKDRQERNSEHDPRGRRRSSFHSEK